MMPTSIWRMIRCGSSSRSLSWNIPPRDPQDHMEHHDIGDLLLHRLKQQPYWFIDECEQWLKELYTELIPDAESKAPGFQLQLTCDTDLEGTSGTFKPIMLRELVSSEGSKLVVIQGIVVKSERPKHKASVVMLKCTNCENLKEVPVPRGFSGAPVPRGCDGNVQRGPMEKCPMNPFQVVTELCKFTDQHA